ncbi:MAG: 3-hydroxyacyl-CoA dehydrogenase family protein, partial [Stackebrandtia sp.]
MNTVGVVGLGTMGAGIAEVFAKGGITVVGTEVDAAALERGKTNVAASLERQLHRGKLDNAAHDRIAERIRYTTDFSRLADVGLVIEAVPERMEIKRELFTKLDKVCAPDTILATNTSSLSVTQIAQTTLRGAKVIGMHFFNPAPVMKLVEVIHTIHTDHGVVTAVTELAERLGKTPVAVSDAPGFIVNRLLLGYLNQAAKLVGEGAADRDEIDAAIKTTGLPMGPLLLADVIGLDTCVEILDVIHDDSASPRHSA